MAEIDGGDQSVTLREEVITFVLGDSFHRCPRRGSRVLRQTRTSLRKKKTCRPEIPMQAAFDGDCLQPSPVWMIGGRVLLHDSSTYSYKFSQLPQNGARSESAFRYCTVPAASGHPPQGHSVRGAPL